MPDDMMDQSIVIPANRWKDLLTEVDALITNALDAGNDAPIVDKCQALIEGIQLRGVLLAKLFCEWKRASVKFGIDPQDWEDHCRDKTGKSPVTIRKYVDLWESVFEQVDEKTFWMLLGKPIQGLLLLPAAVKEDQLDDEDWEEISEAEDANAIRKVVRRVRGDATNSNKAIYITLGRDGVLTAYRGDDEPVSFGYLNYTVPSELGKAAVERILNDANIRRM